MSTLLLLLYITIVICGFLFRKAKGFIVLSFIMAWVLIAGNYENADYAQYLIRYDRGMEVIIDVGFSFICSTFSDWGFDYQEFKAIISAICLIFIIRTISKLCKDPVFGVSLFLLFPLLIDITQFRNFVSYSIVFVAIPYLFKDDRVSTFKYVAIVLLAGTFHTSSLFYLLFVLTKYHVKIVHIILIAVGVFAVKEAIKLYITVMLETNKFENFEVPTIVGVIFGSLIVVLNILMIWYVYKKKQESESDELDLPNMFCTEDKWLYCNLMLIVIIPFLFDNGNYSRIYRNIIVLNMIFVYNAYYLKKNVKVILLSVCYLYFVIGNYFAGSYYNEVFQPVFTYNSIFE